MKKIIVLISILFLNSCIREYYIPLSQDCMDQKIVEIKKTELYPQKIKGYTSSLVYYKDNTNIEHSNNIQPSLQVYLVGNIKFDNKMKLTFTPAKTATDSLNYEHSVKTIEKVNEIIDNINRDKYINTIFMKPFDANCYIGGASLRIPYWLIEQEVTIKVSLDDPLFFSAFKHYLESQGIHLNK